MICSDEASSKKSRSRTRHDLDVPNKGHTHWVEGCELCSGVLEVGPRDLPRGYILQVWLWDTGEVVGRLMWLQTRCVHALRPFVFGFAEL